MLAGQRACPRDCNKGIHPIKDRTNQPKWPAWIREKEGVEEQFPEVEGNSHYEKLWNALDRRELRDFGSTKYFNTASKPSMSERSYLFFSG